MIEIEKYAQAAASTARTPPNSPARRAAIEAENAARVAAEQFVKGLEAERDLAGHCLTRDGWEYVPDSIGGPCWKPPVNKAAADLRAAKAELAAKDAVSDELRARLAEIEAQEPVAWRIQIGELCFHVKNADALLQAVSGMTRHAVPAPEPLFASPVPAQAVPDGLEVCHAV